MVVISSEELKNGIQRVFPLFPDTVSHGWVGINALYAA